ncbi:hypothetical protein F4803DRAFT_543152 [Xylaria telfairii]|nr:hypothetical protein F4803DRAFT_543152 [Xylaria telfairii]
MSTFNLKGRALLSRVFKRSSGWKKVAMVNCILLFIVSVVLIGLFVAAAVQAGGIKDPIFIYEGFCRDHGVSYINFSLHLLINVLSTLVLASTNFFMQILNAPTREEIDAAHIRGMSLEIGVSSPYNLFKISKFRTFCWLGLLISSIPIHLFSNSTVFTTEHREGNHHLTIANEEFLNGGPYFPPGASLLSNQTGFPSDFGNLGNLGDYMDKESKLTKYIAAVAKHGKTWDRMNVLDCMQLYLYNQNGLDHYRDIILVIRQPGGWVRNNMWQHLQPGQNESDYSKEIYYNASSWDHIIPANASNHLFFDTSCTISVHGYGSFTTNCADSLGGDYSGTTERLTNTNPYPFFRHVLIMVNGKSSTMLPGSDNLLVQYCLAEPLESTCYVGLSTALLFAVTLSVVIKSIIAFLATANIVRHYSHNPLVTIGDSIASFIEKPDINTGDWSSVGIINSGTYVGPRKWQISNKRRWVAVPMSIWITSYLLFAISIGFCTYYLLFIVIGHKALTGGFLASNVNPLIGRNFTLLAGILIANSPQILLSASYLAYNSLFTRLQLVREWASYGTGYFPLRVTDPQGNQISTYRLQLPYKYSLPLIVVSVSLHFLVSNTIYIVVSTGGYLKSLYNNVGILPGLPEDSVVVIGYSPISLLVVLIVSSILITIPIIVGSKKLPSDMVVVGANSMAISAACHASCLSQAMSDTHTQSSNTNDGGICERTTSEGMMEVRQRQNRERTWHADMESVSMLADYSTESRAGNNINFTNNLDVLGKIARSRIRWGVVEMPSEWYKIILRDEEVGHLSFGVKEDEVLPPEPGRWYL